MTQEESGRWDNGDNYDRRDMLNALGEHLMENTTANDECCLMFFHSSGQFLGKTVYHPSLFRHRAGMKLPRRLIA